MGEHIFKIISRHRIQLARVVFASRVDLWDTLCMAIRILTVGGGNSDTTNIHLN